MGKKATKDKMAGFVTDFDVENTEKDKQSV